MFHALHHLTLDDKGNIWEDYPNVPDYYLELLTQLFTFSYLKQTDQALLKIFIDMNKYQSLKYKTWRLYEDFDDSCIERLYWNIRNGHKIEVIEKLIEKLNYKGKNMISNPYNHLYFFLNDIEEICDQTADCLFNMPTSSNIVSKNNKPPSSNKVPKNNLIFPNYSNYDIRISEQEARVQFILNLEKFSKYFYSIETPTELKYSDFTTINPKVNAKGRSAEVDLSIYDKKNGEVNKKIINIEFKKGQPDETAINKDLLKLYAEDKFGIWFHLLENARGDINNKNSTISSLIKKLNKGLDVVLKNKSSCIMFFIVILNQNRILSSTIDVKTDKLDIAKLKEKKF